jgi:hypothetical protein
MVRLMRESAAAERALTVTLTAACQKHQQQRAAVVHGSIAADTSLSAVGAAAACILLRLRKGTTAGVDDAMDTEVPFTSATATAIHARDVPLLLSCGW